MIFLDFFTFGLKTFGALSIILFLCCLLLAGLLESKCKVAFSLSGHCIDTILIFFVISLSKLQRIS